MPTKTYYMTVIGCPHYGAFIILSCLFTHSSIVFLNVLVRSGGIPQERSYNRPIVAGPGVKTMILTLPLGNNVPKSLEATLMATVVHLNGRLSCGTGQGSLANPFNRLGSKDSTHGTRIKKLDTTSFPGVRLRGTPTIEGPSPKSSSTLPCK